MDEAVSFPPMSHNLSASKMVPWYSGWYYAYVKQVNHSAKRKLNCISPIVVDLENKLVEWYFLTSCGNQKETMDSKEAFLPIPCNGRSAARAIVSCASSLINEFFIHSRRGYRCIYSLSGDSKWTHKQERDTAHLLRLWDCSNDVKKMHRCHSSSSTSSSLSHCECWRQIFIY